MITIQCHLDHGNRSIRAGMSVSIVRNFTALLATAASCHLRRGEGFPLVNVGETAVVRTLTQDA